MKWEEYEVNYDTNIKKLAVLVKEKMTSMLCLNNQQEWEDGEVLLLGYVDLSTNELVAGKGKLVWPVFEEEQSAFSKFDSETIYLVEARQWIGNGPQIKDIFGFITHDESEFYVTRIMEKNYKHAGLEEILKEYQKPVVIEDSEIGSLTFDRSSGCFNGKIIWKQTEIEVSLDVEAQNKSGCTKAKNYLKQFVKALDKWDLEMKNSAGKKLLNQAIDWSEDGMISEKEIANRIQLVSISMTSGGSFTVVYNDDDIFAGHDIWIDGSMKKGICDVSVQ